MKPTAVTKALEICVRSNRSVFLWGAPGVGKSETVKALAESLNMELIDIRAVLLDPVDLRGLPTVVNGQAKWCPPSFLPTDPDSKGILFLDELNAAPPLVQAACFQLVLDRKVGEYTLPDGWVIIAAGNRETDRGVTHRMATPLANRFVHLEYETDLNDWVTWALNNGIQTELIGFLRFRPNLLHDFDPKRDSKAFPTPRSWAFVSQILDCKPEPSIELDLIAGTVGEGAATELIGFLRIFRKLPNPDMILMNPETAEMPTDPATLYALCGCLAKMATENTFPRLVSYFNRMPDEFSVLAVRDSIARNSALVTTRAYIEWNSKHSAVVL